MTLLNDILATGDKTRVLLFTRESSTVDFFRHVLLFNEKEADFYGKDPISSADFIIFKSDNPAESEVIQPNILFVESATEQAELNALIPTITGGGVLILPNHLNTDETEATSYFRQMPFILPDYKSNKQGTATIQTELGDIPVGNEKLLRDMKGLQLLAQQFGIMEEQFYESLLEYDAG